MSSSRTAAATQQRRINALERRIQAAIALLVANGYKITSPTKENL
jgi:hypothetical protein